MPQTSDSVAPGSRRKRRVPFSPDAPPVGVYRVNAKGAALGFKGYPEGTLVSPHPKALAVGSGFQSGRPVRGWAMPFGLHPRHGNVKWRGVTFFADQVDPRPPLRCGVRKAWNEYRQGDRVLILDNGRNRGESLHCLVPPQVAFMVQPPGEEDGAAIIRGLCDFPARGLLIETQIVSQSSFIWTDAPLTHPESAYSSDKRIRLDPAA